MTEPRQPTHRPYIAGIDGLRALAVLSVLLYHLDPRWVPGGFVGVDVFFVISGFVVSMATSTLKVGGLGGFLLTFYRRRMLRILPAALTFIVVMQLLAVLFIPVRDRIAIPDRTAAAAAAGFSNVVLWLRANDYFSPATELNPFTHTWSLAVEEQFYFLFPVFALLIWVWRDRARRFGTAALAAAAAVSLGLAAYLTPTHPTFAFYMLPARFWELASGMLLFVALERSRAGSLERNLPGIAVALASAAGVVLFAVSIWFMRPDHFPFPNALPPVLASLLLIFVCATAPGSALARALSTPALRYVGRISYSLYLWHWGVIVLMIWTVGLETLPQKLVALAASFALAHLSYSLIETPLRRSRSVASRRNWQVVAAGLVAIALGGGAVVAMTITRPSLTLSSTGDFAAWQPSNHGKDGRCAMTRKRMPFGTGDRFLFVPVSCNGEPDSRQFFILGDSHAWAYERLAGNITRTLGMTTMLFEATGCPFLAPAPLGRSVPWIDPAESAACEAQLDRSFAAVEEDARAGDTLLLPGLRVQRYREYWEDEIRPFVEPVPYTDAALAREAARLRPLLDRGVHVVLELPKPVYKAAAMRCMDWFNRGNPHCSEISVPAAELQARSAVIRADIDRLRAIEPRIDIFDPFPILCPGEICEPAIDGKPVASDGDHMSGFADDYLTPYIVDIIDAPPAS